MMFLRGVAAMILVCLSLIAPARAQQTKSVLTATIATCFPDNTTGLITPAILRTCMNTMIASWQQYASVNAQTGVTYTVQLSDYGQLVTFNNASPVAVSLPQAVSSFATFSFYTTNLGSGTVTITPATSTINGASSFSLVSGQSIFVVSDGSNYQVWNAKTTPGSFGTQSANTALAGPTNGGAALPTFRALVGADLPAPGASSLGGVESLTCSSHNWFNTLSTGGVLGCSQPAFTDITGTVASGQLPTPGVSSLGGVNSKDCSAGGQFLQKINTDGSETCSTPAGGGNVSNTGTPTNHQIAGWTNSTTIQGLGPGTAGQALISGGGSADSSYIGGAWVLLNTLTASNSATLSDTSHITSTYAEYVVVFENIVPASNTVACELQVHTNGSFQTSGYATNNLRIQGATVTGSAGATTFIPCDANGNLANSGTGLSGEITLYNASQTSSPKFWVGNFAENNSSPWMALTSGAYTGGNTAIDGFQVLMSTGNITSGVIKLYGRL